MFRFWKGVSRTEEGSIELSETKAESKVVNLRYSGC